MRSGLSGESVILPCASGAIAVTGSVKATLVSPEPVIFSAAVYSETFCSGSVTTRPSAVCFQFDLAVVAEQADVA